MNATDHRAATEQNAAWKTYRTRFLVKAKQLHCNLAFTDSLGRQHSGRKGDYLVESSDGVLSIAPRRIFEDVYVSMPPAEMSPEPDGSCIALNEPVRERRKLPQPCRGPRPATSLGLM